MHVLNTRIHVQKGASRAKRAGEMWRKRCNCSSSSRATTVSVFSKCVLLGQPGAPLIVWKLDALHLHAAHLSSFVRTGICGSGTENCCLSEVHLCLSL